MAGNSEPQMPSGAESRPWASSWMHAREVREPPDEAALVHEADDFNLAGRWFERQASGRVLTTFESSRSRSQAVLRRGAGRAAMAGREPKPLCRLTR